MAVVISWCLNLVWYYYLWEVLELSEKNWEVMHIPVICIYFFLVYTLARNEFLFPHIGVTYSSFWFLQCNHPVVLFSVDWTPLFVLIGLVPLLFFFGKIMLYIILCFHLLSDRFLQLIYTLSISFIQIINFPIYAFFFIFMSYPVLDGYWMDCC